MGFLDLDLPELKFDGGGVIIRDETLVADGVEEGFAASGAVVYVEGSATVPGDRNAETRASLASFLSLVRIQKFRPNIVFRLGVLYPGRVMRSG